MNLIKNSNNQTKVKIAKLSSILKTRWAISTLILGFAVFVFAFNGGNEYRCVKNSSFKAGETFEYKVKYGFMPVGLATIEVNPQIYSVNNRACYRVNVLGRTSGITDLFRIRNLYRSYIDTAAIVPQKFIMSVHENNYKKELNITFNHALNTVLREEKKDAKSYKVPDNVQDVVSGYYFLRTIDFASLKIGEVINAPMFFDDEIYSMKIKYAGKTTTNTRFGKIKVFKLNPIMPSNKVFEGENAIRIYVSDDKNRVPIKIEADLAVGSVSMELKNYSNVRYDFNWQ